jgi:hypothetical protein
MKIAIEMTTPVPNIKKAIMDMPKGYEVQLWNRFN